MDKPSQEPRLVSTSPLQNNTLDYNTQQMLEKLQGLTLEPSHPLYRIVFPDRKLCKKYQFQSQVNSEVIPMQE